MGYSSPTDFTDSHRWLVALVAAWVWQDAIPSYICVNPCYLWETFLYKKLLCVPWVLWEYSSPTDCTDQHRWLVALVRPRNSQNSQKFGCICGCVGTAGCHTLLHLCKSVISVGGSSLQEASVRSVGSVGYSSPTDCTDQHRWLVALVRPRNPLNSQKFGCVSGCVGTAGCHTLLHLCKSVLSVGDFSLQEVSVRSVGSVGVPLLALLVQQRLLHPLRLHQCHLWKSLLSKKFLCVLWVLWEAISRMWVRGYGRMPYPPIRWGARCPVSSDRCRARRCRSYPRYSR